MEIFRPTSLDKALDMLAAHPPAAVLARGTALMVGVNYYGLRPEAVVAVRRIPELRQIDGGFIGAGCTWAQLEQAPWPALAQAARTVGSPPIRHAGTLAANLGTVRPGGDG